MLFPLGTTAADERLAYLLANVVQALTGGRSVVPQPRDLSRTPWTVQDFLIQRRLKPTRAVAAEVVSDGFVADLDSLLGAAGWDWTEE
jgi:hypothetical protein